MISFHFKLITQKSHPWALLHVPGPCYMFLDLAKRPWALLNVPGPCYTSLGLAIHFWTLLHVHGFCYNPVNLAARHNTLLHIPGPCYTSLGLGYRLLYCATHPTWGYQSYHGCSASVCFTIMVWIP